MNSLKVGQPIPTRVSISGPWRSQLVMAIWKQ